MSNLGDYINVILKILAIAGGTFSCYRRMQNDVCYACDEDEETVDYEWVTEFETAPESTLQSQAWIPNINVENIKLIEIPKVFLWNDNWDELKNEYKKDLAAKKDLKVGSRNVILVRHGQHFPIGDGKNDENTELTSLGKEQAEFLGWRLKELRNQYRVILYSSYFVRAKQTAEILAEALGSPMAIANKTLTEGIPITPEPKVDFWTRQDPEDLRNDGAKLEKAFRKYFFRPTLSTHGVCESYDVIVCPGNVIRYFICRAMQFPPEAWLRFSLHNCSITWIRINHKGLVTLRSLGESGHIPNDKLTY